MLINESWSPAFGAKAGFPLGHGYTLLEDIRKRVREAVDFYEAGYPCQLFSPAGCQRGNDGDSASALMCRIN